MNFLRALALTTSLIVVSSIAWWWQIGDQTELSPAEGLDYAMTPPDIPAGLQTAAGIAAAVMLIAAAAGLLRANLRGQSSPKWWFAVAPALVTGWLLAATVRTMTAGVIGANIGAGLALFIFVPIAVVLGVLSLILATRFGRSTRLSTIPPDAGNLAGHPAHQ